MIAVMTAGTATVAALVALAVVGFWLGLRAPARHEQSIRRYSTRPPRE